jgi:DNA-binding CsgD family transcriptional regulator
LATRCTTSPTRSPRCRCSSRSGSLDAPATTRFSYGYGRAEDLAGLLVIAMIALSSVLVGLVGYKLNPTLAAHVARRPRASSPTPSGVPRRGRERLDAKLTAEVVCLYSSGRSARQIALQLGVGRTTVLDVLRRSDIARRYSRVTAAECENVVSLFRAGVSQSEIGRRIGREASVVWHVLKRAGLVGVREVE